MTALLYFLLWGGLLFVLMRFGCGAHVSGHGPGRHAGSEPPEETRKAVDDGGNAQGKAPGDRPFDRASARPVTARGVEP